MSNTTMCKSIARSLLLVSSFAVILLIAVSIAQAAELPPAANSIVRTNGPNFDIPNLVISRMSVAKTDNVVYVEPNQPLDYVITFKNTDASIATQILTLVDTLPPNQNTTYTGCSIDLPFTGSCIRSGNTVTFTINQTVTAGASGTVHVRVTTNANTPMGQFTNSVVLTYTDANLNTYPTENASDTDTVVLMTVSKTDGRTQVGPGQTLDYVITFANLSTVATQNVTLTDTMPPNTTYQSCMIDPPFSGPACTATGNKVNFTITGQVPAAPNGTGTVHVVVKTDAGIPAGQITNTVVLNYQDLAGTPKTPVNASDTDIVVLGPTAPVMTVTKANAYTTVGPNQTLDYVIAFSNSGTGDATSVTLTDTLPPNTTYQGCSITGPFTGSCSYSPPKTVSFSLNQSVIAGGGGNVHVILTTNPDIPVGSILNIVVLNYKDPVGVSQTPVNANYPNNVVAKPTGPVPGSLPPPSAPAEVPEADTLVLMASGGAGMMSYLLYELRRRRNKSH